MRKSRELNGEHRKLSPSSITKIQQLSEEDLIKAHNIAEMQKLLKELEYPEVEVILREANRLV